jgi:hypothetical protein
LLNHAFNLQFRIVGQLARLALCTSGHFVNHAVHSIFIHRYTSVDCLLLDWFEAQEYYSSASREGEAAAGAVIFLLQHD